MVRKRKDRDRTLLVFVHCPHPLASRITTLNTNPPPPGVAMMEPPPGLSGQAFKGPEPGSHGRAFSSAPSTRN